MEKKKRKERAQKMMERCNIGSREQKQVVEGGSLAWG